MVTPTKAGGHEPRRSDLGDPVPVGDDTDRLLGPHGAAHRLHHVHRRLGPVRRAPSRLQRGAPGVRGARDGRGHGSGAGAGSSQGRGRAAGPRAGGGIGVRGERPRHGPVRRHAQPLRRRRPAIGPGGDPGVVRRPRLAGDDREGRGRGGICGRRVGGGARGVRLPGRRQRDPPEGAVVVGGGRCRSGRRLVHGGRPGDGRSAPDGHRAACVHGDGPGHLRGAAGRAGARRVGGGRRAAVQPVRRDPRCRRVAPRGRPGLRPLDHGRRGPGAHRRLRPSAVRPAAVRSERGRVQRAGVSARTRPSSGPAAGSSARSWAHPSGGRWACGSGAPGPRARGPPTPCRPAWR